MEVGNPSSRNLDSSGTLYQCKCSQLTVNPKVEKIHSRHGLDKKNFDAAESLSAAQ